MVLWILFPGCYISIHAPAQKVTDGSDILFGSKLLPDVINLTSRKTSDFRNFNYDDIIRLEIYFIHFFLATNGVPPHEAYSPLNEKKLLSHTICEIIIQK